MINTITQTTEGIIKQIKKIEEVLQSEVLDIKDYVVSLVDTEDKRIATGGKDGNISISSYDVNNK